MKTGIIITLFACILHVSAFSQPNTATNVSLYPGGIDSLEKHVWKNMRNRFEINRDYLLFFHIVIGPNGIQSVRELYSDSGALSKLLIPAFVATGDRWRKPRNGILNIVVPFFATIDKDSRRGQMAPTITSADFGRNRIPRECILFPPIVFTHYPSSHERLP